MNCPQCGALIHGNFSVRVDSRSLDSNFEAEIQADIAAAKAVAREYGFAWNDSETVEGAVRNILAVLVGERQIHAKELTKLHYSIMKADKELTRLTTFEGIVSPITFWVRDELQKILREVSR
jgi:hypothetical protein